MKTALMISFMLLGQSFNIELAVTQVEQATGLMYRKEWTDSSQGMLFVNKNEKKVSFWMKNTYLDMTMFYLDKDFNIMEIHHPTILTEQSITSKSNNVQYILELNPNLEKFVLKNWVEFTNLIKKQLIIQQESINKLSI